MNMTKLFLVVCIFWIVSEILLQILRRSKKESQNKDLGSTKRLNLVIYASITVGIIVAYTPFGHVSGSNYFLQVSGLVLVIFGLVVRWLAILTLRHYFTVNVAIHSDHKIIQIGLYKYIRHPSYLGMLLSFLGLGVSMCNWMSLVILFIPITIVLFDRIQIEERALHEAFGNDFILYCRKTRKLIPWVY